MDTRTIPEQNWIEFSRQFSRAHLNAPVTIEVLAGESGPQIIADHLPFQGLSFDTKGSRPTTLAISVGQAGGHVSHVVDLPLFIRELDQSDGRVDLEIEPAQGSITLLHLHGQGA